MRELRLALRLISGAGRRDFTRLTLLLTGVALATCALWLGAVQPRVVAYQEGLDGVVVSGPGVTYSDAVLDGKPWTMTTLTGRSETVALPPGLSRWPRPGESVVSPALAQELRRHPEAAAGMGRILPTSLGEAGLADPGELTSYTTVRADAPGARPARISVDVTKGHAPVGSSFGTLAAEAAVLHGLPVVLFLSVCLRVIAGSRVARNRALNLAGLAPNRGARLFGLEMALVAAAGAALGTFAYQAVQAPMGKTGVLGDSWWPDQVRAGPSAALVVAVLTGIAVYLGAHRTMYRHLTRPLSQRIRPLRRLPAAMAGVVLAMAVALLGVRCVLGALHPTGNDADGTRSAILFGGIFAGAVAVLVCVAKLIEIASGWVARVQQPAVRLGARSSVFRSRQTARLVVGVTAVIVLGGLAASFASILGQTAIPHADQWRLSVPLRAIAPSQRALLTGLTTLPTAVSTGTRGNSVLIADCRGTLAQYRLRNHDPHGTVPCSETVQRTGVSRGSGIRAGSEASLAELAERTRHVDVPASASLPAGDWGAKIPGTIDSPWVQQLRSGVVSVFVDLADPRYPALIGQLHARFPTVPIDAGIGTGGGGYTEFTQQRLIVRTGTYTGILLVIGAFVLAVLELRWSSARSLSTLRAVGTSTRVLRVSAMVQYTLPVLVGGGLAATVGVIGGWSYLSLGATSTMFAADVPITCVGAWVVAVVVAAITGYATGGAEFRRDMMADT